MATINMKIGIIRLREDDNEDRQLITRALKKYGLDDTVDFFFYDSTAHLLEMIDENTSVVVLDNRLEGESVTGVQFMQKLREEIKRPLEIIICSGFFTDALYETVNNFRGYAVLKSADESWADNLAITIMRSRETVGLLNEMGKQIKDIKERDKPLLDGRHPIESP